jgi:iron complex transport system ATP-binding protein
VSFNVSNLSFSYGEREVLHDVSFSLGDGCLGAVLGPNGAGKTTLFRCVLGLRDDYRGSIEANGHDVARLSVRERAREMAYIPQAHAAPFDYEVIDVVLMACGTDMGMLRAPRREHEERAMDALERVGIADLAHRVVTRLSGGQQQLVLVARAVAQNARSIVMDEPTSALDFGNTARVLELVRSLADEGRSVLLSTHQPEQAYLYADSVIALADGRVAAVGSPAEVVTSEGVSGLYGMGVLVSPLFGDRARACVPVSCLRSSAAAPSREGREPSRLKGDRLT